MAIGKFIREQRKSKKLTLKQLAQLIGLSYTYLSQIELGDRNASPEILKKLSVALNVPYNELLNLAGYLNKTDLDKLNEAITKLESWLYSRHTQKKYWDSLSLDSEQRKKDEDVYSDNEKFINAYEANLIRLKKIQEQVSDPSEKIEGIDDIITDALYPDVEYRFETPDFSKLTIPKLTNDQAEQLKGNTHTFVFEVPASVESSVNGKSFIMPITKQAAEQSFYDVANLLTLNDKVNLDGRALSPNDIEKILNTIKGMKDQFEYQD